MSCSSTDFENDSDFRPSRARCCLRFRLCRSIRCVYRLLITCSFPFRRDSYSGQPSVIHITTSKGDSRLIRRPSVAIVRSPNTCATTVVMPRFFARHAATLFFPMALILYDFAAYLSTDLIQPGIINVVRDFNADVSLAPAAVSLYLAGGMALQWLLGPLSDRIGRRPVLITGALILPLPALRQCSQRL